MDDFDYSHLLNEPNVFEGDENSKLVFAEAWQYKDDSSTFKHGKLSESELGNWLEQTKPKAETGSSTESREPEAGLRLLILCDCYPHEDTNLPLRTSRKVFEQISDSLSLPKSFLRTLQRGTTAFTKSSSGRSEETVKFVFQNNGQGLGQFSMAVTYNPNLRFTQGLLCGRFNESDLSSFLARLSSAGSLIAFPTLIPIIMVEYRTEIPNQQTHSCKVKLARIEETTGIHRDSIFTPRDDKHLPDAASLDFDHITRDLTSVSSKLAHCNYTCQLHLPMLDFIDRINKDIVASSTSTDAKDKLAPSSDMLADKTAFLRSWLGVISVRTTYLSRRAQAQVQTVYNLIAQRDNATNIQIAGSSLKIAEVSQRDSAEMKAIAEVSKKIAVNTSKDSAAMRTIAAATVIFLPATFTATLFSTSFFNFQAKSGDGLVSQWFWLYWVVTVSLTLLIQSAWYILSRGKERKIEKVFEDEKKR